MVVGNFDDTPPGGHCSKQFRSYPIILASDLWNSPWVPSSPAAPRSFASDQNAAAISRERKILCNQRVMTSIVKRHLDGGPRVPWTTDGVRVTVVEVDSSQRKKRSP
jgi:hypothetical protein